MRKVFIILAVLLFSFFQGGEGYTRKKTDTALTIKELVHHLDNVKQKEIEILSKQFNVSKDIAEAIWKVSVMEKIDPYLVASLIQAESSFRKDAISPRNYHGLTQIPYRLPYPEANVLVGIKILKEKIQIAEKRTGRKIRSLLDVTEMTPEERVVLMEAIRLYKGYVKKKHVNKGLARARKVIDIALLKKTTTNNT